MYKHGGLKVLLFGYITIVHYQPFHSSLGFRLVLEFRLGLEFRPAIKPKLNPNSNLIVDNGNGEELRWMKMQLFGLFDRMIL